MINNTIDLLQLAVTALRDIENGWPLDELAALSGKGLEDLVADLEAHIKHLEAPTPRTTSPSVSSVVTTYRYTIDVNTRENVTEDAIRNTLDRLINAGLEAAQSTLENNEGNLEAAQLSVNLNITSPVLRSIHRLPPSNKTNTVLAMEEALRLAGYTIFEDPEDPSRWLWRAEPESSKASYDLRAEAIYEAWGHAEARVRTITGQTASEFDALSFTEQEALIANTLGAPSSQS